MFGLGQLRDKLPGSNVFRKYVTLYATFYLDTIISGQKWTIAAISGLDLINSAFSTLSRLEKRLRGHWGSEELLFNQLPSRQTISF